MGSIKAGKRQRRVASFDVYKIKNKRVFKPVNKRAKAYAKALKSKSLTLEQMRKLKALGKHKIVVYDNPLSNHFLTLKG